MSNLKIEDFLMGCQIGQGFWADCPCGKTITGSSDNYDGAADFSLKILNLGWIYNQPLFYCSNECREDITKAFINGQPIKKEG